MGAAVGGPFLVVSQWIGDPTWAFVIGWFAGLFVDGLNDIIADRKARRQEGEG